MECHYELSFQNGHFLFTARNLEFVSLEETASISKISCLRMKTNCVSFLRTI
jgi:hypothetical protein